MRLSNAQQLPPTLQAADIGIGIMGKEGRQAVNNSDYGIGQFRWVAGEERPCMRAQG